MAEYTINFIIWWYFYKLPEISRTILFQYVFMLNKTRSLPMAQNLFKPLYGDTSSTGILIGIPIRFFWMMGGGILSTLYIIPFVLFLLLFATLPLVPVIQIFNLAAQTMHIFT